MINIKCDGSIYVDLLSFALWCNDHSTHIKIDNIYVHIARDYYWAAKRNESDEYLWITLTFRHFFSVSLYFDYSFSIPVIALELYKPIKILGFVSRFKNYYKKDRGQK